MRELLSVYNLGSGKKASAYRDGTAGANVNANEQIISLGDGFDKY